MKTLNELYNEVTDSDELKNEFLALNTPEDIVAFAKKHGCDASLDDIKAFFEEKKNAAGELSEADLEQVAGGKSVSGKEALMSIFTAGLSCTGAVIASAILGKAGTAIKGHGMLCAVDDKDNTFLDT